MDAVLTLSWRLTRGLQHKIHTYVMGGLYPGPDIVERVLAPEWGVEKAVLDVGTGPGHW